MVTKTLSKKHMLQALTQYMNALSAINDNEVVTKFKRASDGYEVTVEQVKNND